MPIYYTGIGCLETYYHTNDEFIEIMQKNFTWKDWTYEINNSTLPSELIFKDFNLPHDFMIFTLDDWVEYSGAIKYDDQ